MNILHHKSWHVRNQDNVDRVRKDEEKARLEEEKKAKRAALAEQEARTAFLRSRSKGSQDAQLTADTSKESSEIVPISKQRHINFFQDIEEGLRQGSNPEYEAEKKAEQEKQEKAIGLLTYLGQSASEKHAEKPWYLKKDVKKQESDVKDNISAKDSKRKDSLDPLKAMKKYLEAKETHSKHKHKKHSKDKKHHNHKKDKRKEEKASKKKGIEELRAERIRRENLERARETELVSISKGEKQVTKPEEENPYKYNSQFNPDLVRKPQSRNHQRYRPY